MEPYALVPLILLPHSNLVRKDAVPTQGNNPSLDEEENTNLWDSKVQRLYYTFLLPKPYNGVFLELHSLKKSLFRS